MKKSLLTFAILLVACTGIPIGEQSQIGDKHEHVDKMKDGKCYKSICTMKQNGAHKYWYTERLDPVACPVPLQ